MTRIVPRRIAATFVSTSGLVAALTGLAAAQGATTPDEPETGPLVFADRAAATGTTNLSYGRGVAMVDLDMDGRLDIVCADAGMVDSFYRQTPARDFAPANSLWDVPPVVAQSWGVLATDFDNDGDPDVYFFSGGFGMWDAGPPMSAPNQYLRNDIPTTGGFTDTTAAGGDIVDTNENFGGSALDYDRDGFLDIFMSNRKATCTLLRNVDGSFFVDVSAQAGFIQSGDYRCCGVGDIDNDGWVDIGVGNFQAENRLYRNQGDGTFVDIATSAGIPVPSGIFGFFFDDLNNDGWLDIYLPKYSVNSSPPSPLLLNQMDGTFLDAAPGSGLGSHTDMGHILADFDNDGYPDLLVGTGHPLFEELDVLYRIEPNGAGLRVTDVSAESGIIASGESRMHGMGVGDYDEDGDLDVYCNNGGPYVQPHTLEENFFWENQGNENSWAAYDLEGVLSNRSAVGARGIAYLPSGRTVHRTIAVGQGFGNTPSPTMHFGLGDEQILIRIELTWPSGVRQVLASPTSNTRERVIETGLLLRGTPTVGATFDLDVCGPSGHRVDLYTALGTGTSFVAGIDGWIELDHPQLFGSFDLPAAGVGTVHANIPPNPNLAGRTFYVQGWVRPADGSDGGTFTRSIELTIQ